MNIVFVAMYVSVVGGAIIHSLNTVGNPPYFQNDNESPEENITLNDSLKRINKGLKTFKHHVGLLVNSMREVYHIDVTDQNTETESFMDFPLTNTTLDRDLFLYSFCNDTTLFLQTMRKHYDMLNQLANYFQQLRNTTIEYSPPTSLVSIQNYIYEVMCSIEITLRSKDQDPVTDVPSGHVSDTFIQARGSSRHKRQLSEYVTMLDSERLATYLDTLYVTFNTTVLWC